MTVAVVDAVYSFSTPGVNGAEAAARPSVSASVAGTVPPAAASATFARSAVTTATSTSALSWKPSLTRTLQRVRRVLVDEPLVGDPQFARTRHDREDPGAVAAGDAAR